MTVATDFGLVSPYTDEGYLSYVANVDGTGVQQHPGNGVGFEVDGVSGERTVTICTRYSVARTRRGYCTDTPASTVYSLTLVCVKPYGTDSGAVPPELDRGPYTCYLYRPSSEGLLLRL